jgi:hypothetical protein
MLFGHWVIPDECVPQQPENSNNNDLIDQMDHSTTNAEWICSFRVTTKSQPTQTIGTTIDDTTTTTAVPPTTASTEIKQFLSTCIQPGLCLYTHVTLRQRPIFLAYRALLLLLLPNGSNDNNKSSIMDMRDMKGMSNQRTIRLTRNKINIHH